MGCGNCDLFSGAHNAVRSQNLAFANNGKRSRRSRRGNRRANRAVDTVVVDHGINRFARHGLGCCGCGCLDGFFCCGGIGYSSDPLLYDW